MVETVYAEDFLCWENKVFADNFVKTLNKTWYGCLPKAERITEYDGIQFGELLEEAAALELLEVSRDSSAGGTWVVRGFGKKAPSPVSSKVASISKGSKFAIREGGLTVGAGVITDIIE